MKILPKIVLTILFLATFLSVLLFANGYTMKAKAYSTKCPTYMNDYQCLAYLQQQAALIAAEKKNLNSKISQEQYNQLSLLEKISYLDGQIVSAQKQIDDLEIQIATKNVEVRILAQDIADKQNTVNTLEQEIIVLNSNIGKRVALSYKYSFLTPLEIVLESDNFDALLRRMKYLNESKKKDREMLSTMGNKQKAVNDEKSVLEGKKKEVERKRAEIEEKKTELFALNQSLAKQRNDRSVLYAQSKERERELVAKLNRNRIRQSQLDAAIIAYIAKTQGKAVYGGRVAKGKAIGTMGNTGLSTGTHLHFSVGTKGYPVGQGNVSPWKYLVKGPDYWAKYSGWTYYYIHAGSFNIPVAGKPILTQNYHQGYSIDMTSINPATGGVYGEGQALVYAVLPGKIYSGTDQFGGRYVWIDHDNNLRTTYLHLKNVYVIR